MKRVQYNTARLQAEAQPALRAPQQAEVHAGYDSRGMQLHALQVVHREAAQGVQGQVLAQVHQEGCGQEGQGSLQPRSPQQLYAARKRHIKFDL